MTNLSQKMTFFSGFSLILFSILYHTVRRPSEKEGNGVNLGLSLFPLACAVRKSEER